MAVNCVAYYHAYRMTHFAIAGEQTRAPQRLNGWQRAAVLAAGVTVPRPVNSRTPADLGWQFRTVTITTRDGVTLEVWEIPHDNSVAVVAMFHGYAMSKDSLLHEAAVFRELGGHVLLADHRGAGGSAGNTTTLGWEEALDVAAVAGWAGQQQPRRRLILYGQSLGAAAVLRAVATEKVQADGLVLEAPFDRLLTTVGHRYRAMHLPAFPLAHLLVVWGGVQHGYNAFALNPAVDARAVACPALVTIGDRDPWIGVDEARAVATAMPGGATLKVFENVGHESICRAAPEAYRRAIRDWWGQTR